MPADQEKPVLAIRLLTWPDAQSLATRINPDEAYECGALGQTPLGGMATALLGAILGEGHAWCVYRTCTGTPVGAFGFNPDSACVWSLWASMGRREQRLVAEKTPEWIRHMVDLQGGPLSNIISTRNKTGLKWLKLSKCFNFGPEANGWIAFQTKEDLLNVR